MKKADSPATIEKLLQNDPTARARFLGPDERGLTTIIKADNAAIRRRGLTHARVAKCLLALRHAGWVGQGDPVSVPPHFEVRVDAARGKLSCPFGDSGSFAKVNTTVRNLERGTEITFTDLNIHLIAKHGFYEGRGAPFRLDPGQLVDVLEMDLFNLRPQYGRVPSAPLRPSARPDS